MAKRHVLTALAVKNAQPGDKLSDGGGLRLDVDRSGNASWIFRFTSPATGGERFMGLGSLHDVTLAKARHAADDARELLRNGRDPIEARRGAVAAAKVAEHRAVTFQAYAERYVATHEQAWKNAKHRQQWRNSLRDYVYPAIGHMPIADVTTEDVRSLLAPIWLVKRETAARIRGRLEMIFGAAIHGDKIRTAENPALLATIRHTLPAQRRMATRQHFAALPWQEMPKFFARLSGDLSEASRHLRWIILTAARFNASVPHEGEIHGDVWSIPGARMKTGKAFTIPLASQALALLPIVGVSDTSLTTCIRRHTATPATTHGFRSTFRDWCGDASDFPRELAEMALGHAFGDEVERAYRRGSALEKRRALMAAWAAFVTGA